MLDSLKNQSLAPDKILVYIPYGYDLPKETIGIETYVRCEKGMVHQRSLSFDEVDTEWILFLDDDVYIPTDGVERLFDGVEEYDGDCISPDVFRSHEKSVVEKLKVALGFTFPHYSDKWAFKFWNGGNTYNNCPKKDILLSQSAAGLSCLVKKEIYKSIHFEDERWMDDFCYPAGEDAVFYFKMYLMGYRLLVHYNACFVHLDAGTGRISKNTERYLKVQTIGHVRWYRTRFHLRHNTWYDKCVAILSLLFKGSWMFFFHAVPRMVKHCDIRYAFNFFLSYKLAWEYVNSDKFRKLPSYDEYVKNET